MSRRFSASSALLSIVGASQLRRRFSASSALLSFVGASQLRRRFVSPSSPPPKSNAR
jgi:hypothetical protein